MFLDQKRGQEDGGGSEVVDEVLFFIRFCNAWIVDEK